MIVKDMNEGAKIQYDVTGNKIFFGDDELMLNLARYERDEQIVIDICVDDDAILIAGLSKYYVANIIIPARAYDGETPVPFDIDRVELCLWALPAQEV